MMGRRYRLGFAVGAACAFACACTATRDAQPSAPVNASAVGTPDPMRATGVPTMADIVNSSPAPLATEAATATASLDWILRGLSQDGRRVYLLYGVGEPSCLTFLGLQVTQRPDEVTIASLARKVPSPGDCLADLPIRPGYVELSEPLGSRQLVHADLFD